MTQPQNEQTTPAPAEAQRTAERLRARVAERRAAGLYPEGLEAQLDDHFRRIVLHKSAAAPDGLHIALERVEQASSFRPDVPVDSSVPGGELLHRAVNKALARQAQLMTSQMQQFADATRDALRLLAEGQQSGSSHVHGDLVGRLDAVLERLDRLERATSANAEALEDLRSAMTSNGRPSA
jgi:hypothetical protein